MSNLDISRVKKHINSGAFEKALQDCQTVIAANPRDALALQYASVSLANLGRYTEALKMGEIALEIDPNLVVPHVTMALIYDELGDRAQSRIEVGNALKKDPDSPDVLFCLGILALGANQLEDAIRYLEKAVKIERSFFLAHYNLATAYQLKGDLKNLLRKTLTVVRIRPTTRNIFRLIYLITRLFRCAELPVLFASALLSLLVGAEFVLVITTLLIFLYLAGGVFIGFMAKDKQPKQFLINIGMGFGTGLLGILIYLLIS